MNKIILVGILFISTLSFAQKNMTTNAALAWRHYNESMASGDQAGAEKDLVEAYDYITAAAAHETTMNDPKTLMYKGQIYCEIAKFSKMATNEKLKALDGKTMIDEGIAAFKKSGENDSRGKYEDNIIDYCSRMRSMSYNGSIKQYEEKKYEAAMQGFLMSAKFGEVMGMVDSVAGYYGAISANKAEKYEIALAAFSKSADIGYEVASSASMMSELYIKLNKQEEGEQKLAALLKANPGNKDIMISLINLYLGSGKKAEAEKVLSDAIALDPNNKELHYVVGTIYEEQERYDDAEAAYKKVLEIDPEHANALFSLGRVYFNKAAVLNGKINELAVGDPKEDEYRAQMTENFKKALPYLEKAYALNPNDKEIVGSLRQAYYKTGNAEKASEMKKKYDSLK